MTNHEKKQKAKPSSKKVFEILLGFFNDCPKPRMTIGELRDAFSDRAYGLLMLVLAFPTVLPIPTPGLSAVLGLPLVLVTFQLMVGIKSPWFPNWLENKSFSCAQMKKSLDKILPYIKTIEMIFKPRLEFLVNSKAAERIIAAVCLILSCAILLPIPFGNAAPAFSIFLFALAILYRDGLLVILGALSTIASLTLISTFIDVIINLFSNLF